MITFAKKIIEQLNDRLDMLHHCELMLKQSENELQIFLHSKDPYCYQRLFYQNPNHLIKEIKKYKAIQARIIQSCINLKNQLSIILNF